MQNGFGPQHFNWCHHPASGNVKSSFDCTEVRSACTLRSPSEMCNKQILPFVHNMCYAPEIREAICMLAEPRSRVLERLETPEALRWFHQSISLLPLVCPPVVGRLLPFNRPAISSARVSWRVQHRNPRRLVDTSFAQRLRTVLAKTARYLKTCWIQQTSVPNVLQHADLNLCRSPFNTS